MRVLVTGANGHLGQNLCRALAAGGHAVRGSVRELSDPSRTEVLRGIDGLELVEADIYRPEQLRAALDGIDLFFHVAAVYAYVLGDGQEADVVAASITGAENALRAAADAGVRKVVLTSSVVTLPLRARGERPSTEEDWNEDFRIPYFRAKTLAEKRAWELARDLRLDLVTVLPGAICGPGFQRDTPSIDVIEAIMRGALRMGVPNVNFPYVDIRDVVRGHVLAGDQDCAGRFILCNDHLPYFAEIVAAMRAIDPGVPRSLMPMPDFMLPFGPLFDRLNHRLLGTPRVMVPELMATIRGRIWNASNARAKAELGWRPEISLETSLRDTLALLRARDARPAG